MNRILIDKKMNKRLIFLSILLTFTSNLVFAQSNMNVIGINTTNPQQAFHIDPKANTTTDNRVSQSDDVVFTKDGSVGIGTINPQIGQKLDIQGNTKIGGTTITNDTVLVKGTGIATNIGVNTSNPTANLHLVSNSSDKIGIRIADGTESEGAILTASSTGEAYWSQLKPMASIVYGTLQSDIIVQSDILTSITKDTLSLAPGRWLVLAKSSVGNRVNEDGSTTDYNTEGFYVYMKLMAEVGYNGDTSNAPVLLGTNGSSAEQVDGSARAASPNILTVIDIPIKEGVEPSLPDYNTKVWISLSCSRTTRTDETYGNMQFYALRIDRPQ